MNNFKVLIMISLLFLLPSCYNYHELNELALVSAIGINKIDNEYEVILEVINTSKESGNDTLKKDKFTIYKANGKSLFEALKKVALKTSHTIYFKHLSLLLINDNVLDESILNILDLFIRNPEFRKQFLVLTSKNNEAEQILNKVTNMEEINAKDITEKLVSNYNMLGIPSKLTFEELLINLLNDKQELFIPNIILDNSEIILDGIAIFNKDKRLGYLNNNDSINLSILLNKIKQSYYNYECDLDKFVNIEIINVDTKIKNDKQKINININIEGYISDTNCHIDLTDYKKIEKLEKDVASDISNSIYQTIKNTIIKYNSDIFGFQNIIYKNNPKLYKDLKEKYNDDILKYLSFNINTKIKLSTKGNILKEINNE